MYDQQLALSGAPPTEVHPPAPDHNLAALARSQIALEKSQDALERCRAALDRLPGARGASGGRPQSRRWPLYPHRAGRAASRNVAARGLIAVVEEERRRISLELHDGINQRIAASCISLRRLQERLEDGPACAQLAEVLEVLSGLADDVRHLSHTMHPPVLDLAGLGVALRAYCQEMFILARLEVEVAVGGLPPIPADVGLCMYRVAQEALGNVVAHSGVHRARLSMRRRGGVLEMEVTDEGSGFDVDGTARGLGLTGMAERVRLMGGSLAVRSRPGRGTMILARIPVRSPDEAVPRGIRRRLSRRLRASLLTGGAEWLGWMRGWIRPQRHPAGDAHSI